MGSLRKPLKLNCVESSTRGTQCGYSQRIQPSPRLASYLSFVCYTKALPSSLGLNDRFEARLKSITPSMPAFADGNGQRGCYVWLQLLKVKGCRPCWPLHRVSWRCAFCSGW